MPRSVERRRKEKVNERKSGMTSNFGGVGENLLGQLEKEIVDKFEVKV